MSLTTDIVENHFVVDCPTESHFGAPLHATEHIEPAANMWLLRSSDSALENQSGGLLHGPVPGQFLDAWQLHAVRSLSITNSCRGAACEGACGQHSVFLAGSSSFLIQAASAVFLLEYINLSPSLRFATRCRESSTGRGNLKTVGLDGPCW